MYSQLGNIYSGLKGKLFVFNYNTHIFSKAEQKEILLRNILPLKHIIILICPFPGSFFSVRKKLVELCGGVSKGENNHLIFDNQIIVGSLSQYSLLFLKQKECKC